MRKLKTAIDVIEKAKNYSLLSKSYLDKPIHIGSRKKLAQILAAVSADDIIATYGSSQRCIILMDMQLGELMDLIQERKYLN